MLKIVQCSDLHIGAPFKGLSPEKGKIRRDEIKQSFNTICEFCRQKEADILLIPGDLFDSPFPTLPDIEFVKKNLEKLDNVQIFITCGNHDCMETGSVFTKKIFGENVHIFPTHDSFFILENKKVCVSGKSFASKVMNRDFDLTGYKQDYFNILCLHGDITASSSYHIADKSSLLNSRFDYIALGHVHSQQIFKGENALCAYSGTPEGHGFSDSEAYGFLYAEIDSEIKLQQIKTVKRDYVNLKLDISDCKTSFDVISLIKPKLHKDNLYSVYMYGSIDPGSDISLSYIESELENDAFYIELNRDISQKEDLDMLFEEESLKGEFLRNLRENSASESEFTLAGTIGLSALNGQNIIEELL